MSCLSKMCPLICVVMGWISVIVLLGVESKLIIGGRGLHGGTVVVGESCEYDSFLLLQCCKDLAIFIQKHLQNFSCSAYLCYSYQVSC